MFCPVTGWRAEFKFVLPDGAEIVRASPEPIAVFGTRAFLGVSASRILKPVAERYGAGGWQPIEVPKKRRDLS